MRSGQRRNLTVEYGLAILCVAVFILFSILQPAYFSAYNLMNLLMQTSLLALMACGLTIVMTLDEFDLSIGFLAGMTGAIAVVMVNRGFSPAFVFFAPIAIGAVAGLLNGFLVADAGLISFIATLGTGTVFSGLSFYISGGGTVAIGQMPPWFLFLGQGEILGIPVLIFLMFIVFLAFDIMLNYTQTGRTMYGIGSNCEAARIEGINIAKHKIIGFVISGAISGFCGFLIASRIGAAHPKAGEPFLLGAFAAVFMGMTMKGGQPNIIGTLLGAFLMREIQGGLSMVFVPASYQDFIAGLILVLGVAASYLIRNTQRDTA